jgi:hypothetical protein
MSKKILVVLFALVVLECASARPAAAQSGCLGFTDWWQQNGPAPIGWFYYSSYPGTYAIEVAFVLASCAPADAAPETCPGCTNPQAGLPIADRGGTTFS